MGLKEKIVAEPLLVAEPVLTNPIEVVSWRDIKRSLTNQKCDRAVLRSLSHTAKESSAKALGLVLDGVERSRSRQQRLINLLVKSE